MGGFLSPSPATTTTSGSSTQTTTPSPAITGNWNDILGTARGFVTGPGGIVNNYTYPGPLVANPTELMNQYYANAGAYGQFDPQSLLNTQNNMVSASGDIYNTQRNPNDINLPQYNAQSFQPGQLNLPGFGNVPTVNAPTGPSGLASSYLVNPGQIQAPQAYTPQQVQAMMVNAPGSVNPITGVPNVSAPQLNQYQMQAAANISAPQLQQYLMQAAQNVAPQGQATTQSWNDPGTAASYMSPYTQQVVNAQLAQAQTQNQQQLQQQAAQSAQAGAFGGSRQAVEAANQNLGYQQLAANLQAQGLQSAYTQGQQQFNTQQALGQQAQQYNISTGLQAQLANQQMQQQANQANLQSQLQTQGLGTNAQMQALLANQANQQQANVQNLSSYLQTQGLGAQTGMQAQLANQTMGYQTQLANQQAQEFGLTQQQQAALANQQANLSAQQMNQAAGLQSGLANMQYQYGASQGNVANALQAGLAAQQLGYQGAAFNAGNQMQAGLANQAANMQAQTLGYQGGLQGALQTQNLGMQGQLAGGQLGLQSAMQQAGLQQNQQGLNMAAIQNAAGLQNQAANLGLQGYQVGLQGQNALQQAGTSQQGWAQQVKDAGYQQWLNSFALPMQGLGALATMNQMALSGYPSTVSNVWNQTGTSMPAQPSGLSQILSGVLGGLGAFGGIFGRKGGLAEKLPVKKTGIAAIPKRSVPRRRGLDQAAA